MIFGWLIVVGFIVMSLPLKDDTSEDKPATRYPFSQLASLDKQIYRSEPPLGQTVQIVSTSVTNSLSRLVPCRVNISCKFIFGVGMGWVGMKQVRIADWNCLDPCLDRVRSLLNKCH